MSLPRILAIIGSGETAPAMVRVHRELFRRLDAAAATADGALVQATLLDSTYGFQENADELTERIRGYFRSSVGRELSVASYRSADVDGRTLATAVARIDESAFVLAGPGSPTYALRAWASGPIRDALARKARDGGVLVMASAAALTLGLVTVPVYEIYKVGDSPTWLEGLDLLGAAAGLRAAVVPHYDNAEGGTHDTRFCYLGERRLAMLEALLPPDTFVLGVDSHTALILDVDAGTAIVAGLGGVTVRVGGRSQVFPTGSRLAIEDLRTAAVELATGQGSAAVPLTLAEFAAPGPEAAGASDVAMAHLADAAAEMMAGLRERDARRALDALLAFDEALAERLSTGDPDPEVEEARGLYRSLIVRLGEAAMTGLRDPRDAVTPFVDTLLEIRARARDSRDWAMADLIRDRLEAAGVEVRDGDAGSEWLLAAAAQR